MRLYYWERRRAPVTGESYSQQVELTAPTDEMVEAAARALDERWPRLGILSRAVVYRHPSKVEIARVALNAALENLQTQGEVE